MTEIVRIDPLRAANVIALVYGAIMLAFSLFAVPWLLLMPIETGSGDPVNRGPLLAFAVLYPIFGLLIGWLTGLLSASCYNLIARRIGGIRVQTATHPAAAAA